VEHDEGDIDFKPEEIPFLPIPQVNMHAYGSRRLNYTLE
jgi:hypothetical protein